MAIIQSGASADLATIDPISKAIRVTPYRPDGTTLEIAYTGEYYISINIPRFTVALPAGSVLFAIRNGATKKMKILMMEMNPTFDGTVAASTSQYSVKRFTTATPTGGTALTTFVVPEDSAMAASTIIDARCATAIAGLTTTGVVTTGPVFGAMISHGSNGGGVNFEMHADLVLNVNEGLLVSMDVAGVIGDAMSVNMYWGEY